MAQPTLPTKPPQWADTGVITEPTTPYKSAGWTAIKPPFAYFNWWMNLVYSWVLYLNAKVNFLPGTLADEVLTITANLVTPTQANSTFGAVTANLYGATFTNFTTGGLWLARGNGTNPVTLFHQQAAAPAYFQLAGNCAVVLNDKKDYILFQLNADGYWYEVARSASLPHGGVLIGAGGANTIVNGDENILVDTSGGAATMTLPTAAQNKGRTFRVKKTTSDANTVTISTTSSQTIDGVTTAILSNQNQALVVISDGSNWHTLAPPVAKQQVPVFGGTSAASSGTTYTATVSPKFGAYFTGMAVTFKVDAVSTGAATINVDALGAKALVDCEGAALVGGELKAGQMVLAVYDGTSFLAQGVLAAADIQMTGGNGNGSTDTMIRRFVTTVKSVGTAMTLATSAANGTTVTINKAGSYVISCKDRSSTDSRFGISRSSAQLTTSIEAITNANRLTNTQGPAASVNTCGCAAQLAAGDVIRFHNAGAMDFTTDVGVGFNITRVG